MNNPLRSTLSALGALLLHPVRLFALLVLGFVVVVVAIAGRQYSGELKAVSGPAVALGHFALGVQAAQLPTRAAPVELPAPQSVLVTGRPKGKRTLAHPFGGKPITPVQLVPIPFSTPPEQMQQRTAAQQAAITKETGLQAPPAGEVVIYGPVRVPCLLDPQNHDTFGCSPNKHATFRGNVEVRKSLATGALRLVPVQLPRGFLEWRGLSEGWEVAAGLTYGASAPTAGGISAGAAAVQLGPGGTLHVGKDLVRMGSAWWHAELAGDFGRGRVDGRAALLAVWRSVP